MIICMLISAIVMFPFFLQWNQIRKWIKEDYDNTKDKRNRI